MWRRYWYAIHSRNIWVPLFKDSSHPISTINPDPKGKAGKAQHHDQKAEWPMPTTQQTENPSTGRLEFCIVSMEGDGLELRIWKAETETYVACVCHGIQLHPTSSNQDNGNKRRFCPPGVIANCLTLVALSHLNQPIMQCVKNHSSTTRATKSSALTSDPLSLGRTLAVSSRAPALVSCSLWEARKAKVQTLQLAARAGARPRPLPQLRQEQGQKRQQQQQQQQQQQIGKVLLYSLVLVLGLELVYYQEHL